MIELNKETDPFNLRCTMCKKRKGHAKALGLGWICKPCLYKLKRVAHANGYLPDVQTRSEVVEAQAGQVQERAGPGGCAVWVMVLAVAVVLVLLAAPSILRF